MKNVIVICGPTGVGKTEMSIALAKKLGGEIINGDAYQIYEDLNIGTAKITSEEMQGVPHHLFNILSFKDECSVADYQKVAREKIDEVLSRGNIPIIVGGSGYYLKTILYDYKFSEVEQTDFSKYSNEELYEKLKLINPEWASNLHQNNRIRIERALQAGGEVAPIGELLYDCLLIGITMDREELYERINKRVDIMLENGLLNEIKQLLEKGATFDMQSMKAIGYKEFSDYFNGNASLEEVVEIVKRNSRRYAKKQYTWFRNQMEVHWVEKNSVEDFLANELNDLLK